MNKRNKTFITILTVVIMCIGIMILINKNNISMAAYKEGQKGISLGTLYDNPNLYCISFNLDYSSKDLYKCYEVDQGFDILQRKISYLIDTGAKNYGRVESNEDLVSNMIWYYYDRGQFHTEYFTKKQILDKDAEATAAAKVTLSGNVGIYNLQENQNPSGIYGPFIAFYPNYNGKPIGDVKISINGNVLSDIPISGEKFYLSRADGIIDGIENSIKISYTGKVYTGIKYAKFTPEDEEKQGVNQDVIYIEPIYIPVTEEKEAQVLTIEKKINLSGQVFIDGQTELKPVKSANGVYDNGESLLANVTVNARRVSDDQIQATTITDATGKYQFKDLPIGMNGNIAYYVEFIYDGISYITTTTDAGNNDTIDSDVYEIERLEFNNKFRTIVKNTALSTDGTPQLLEYKYNNNEAVLNTTEMDGITIKPQYVMKAVTTSTYIQDTTNIDMGLVVRGVDLSAVTDINSARVTVNGITKEYSYNDIISLEDNITVSDNEATYNLYLYNSDYNYRISNYSALPMLDSATKGTLTSDDDKSALLYAKMGGELNVELTYRVLLNNQSATKATINQIAYYYDSRYILNNVNPNLATEVEIDGIKYKKMIFNVNQEFTNFDNQSIYNVTFTVGKDNLGALYTGEMKTWVEIISYSTDEGCIDIDSAPDNITEHKTEDDSDDARGLNIQVNMAERTINGYVFEDKKSNNPGTYNTGNGEYENGETKVNDVIVQLIEIQEIEINNAKIKLEYIWQETVSGQSTVKYITTDGKVIATYENGVTEQGEYKFTGFIPGKYIVRFIYGDGTYYDKTINGSDTSNNSKVNILKYNGQDYKSTVDPYYNETYFSKTYKKNNSMARDNEARRIEEMAYATDTNKTANDLIIDKKEELDNTWMCADTSTILIPVSNSQNDTVTEQVNFGLVQRPQVKLSLEKHITYLKIDGVTEARAGLDDYESDKGILNINLFATTTNKKLNQRGSWIVQTQMEEIAGKRLDVTYSYRVTNIGDLEYIGKNLSGKIYSEVANVVKEEIANSNYKIGSYLGKAYYSGNPDSEIDVFVNTTFKIEDYLGETNTLTGVLEKDFKHTDNPTKKVWTSSGRESTEKVKAIQTEVLTLANNGKTVSLDLYNPSIDVTSGNKRFTYRSYAAQLIAGDTITSKAGTLIKTVNSYTGELGNLGNLTYVQAYTDDVELKDITPEADESVAETIVITLDTGADKITPIILITVITGGFAIIAIGVILIKKHVIK